MRLPPNGLEKVGHIIAFFLMPLENVACTSRLNMTPAMRWLYVQFNANGSVYIVSDKLFKMLYACHSCASINVTYMIDSQKVNDVIGAEPSWKRKCFLIYTISMWAVQERGDESCYNRFPRMLFNHQMNGIYAESVSPRAR